MKSDYTFSKSRSYHYEIVSYKFKKLEQTQINACCYDFLLKYKEMWRMIPSIEGTM